MGLLDIVTAHQQALLGLLDHANPPAANRETVQRAADFLAECLSSYDMTQRAFQETIASLNSLNRRLEDEVENRTRELRESEERYRVLARHQFVIAQFGQLALSAMALDELISEAIQRIAWTLDVDACGFLEIQPDGKSLLLREGVGWNKGLVGTARVRAGAGSQVEHTLHSDGTVITHNLASEGRFTSLAILTDHGLISGMTVTVRGKDQPHGILSAHTRQYRQFTADEGAFLQSIANVLGMAIDNRNLLETEARRREVAEQLNEQRLRALAIVSHELRTPLSSIKGFASTLLAEDVTWDANSQRDFIQTIDQESDKLSNLLEQILDLSKMEAGVFKLAVAETWVDEIIATARAQMSALTGKHELVIRAPDSLPPVLADPLRIGQVVVNLVENAAKYSPEHTRIVVSAVARDRCVEMSVADRGPGIPPEEREKVFMPFYQTTNPAAARVKGAGLGLTICRRLIEAHGGRIWIKNRRGQGTEIAFTLPLAGTGEDRG